MLEQIQHIKDLIALAVSQEFNLTLSADSVAVEAPANELWGDYSSNIAMTLVKELKQSPMAIANSICYRIKATNPTFTYKDVQTPVFDDIQPAAPGFINFKFSSQWLLSVLNQVIVSDKGYGSSDLGRARVVALEHSNVNPNKAPHIGHLRNAVIGEFIEKIYEFLGYDVQVQYYSNDIGVQVATSYLGTLKCRDIKQTSYDRIDYYAWDVYAEISEALANNPSLKAELEDILIQVEDPSSVVATEVATLADSILAAQLDTFSRLLITYDVIIHERDILYLKLWEECFTLLKQNPNVYLATEGKSKGCWLVRFAGDSGSDNYEKDKIIVRSNGVPTYTGKDIAYHMWKFGVLSKDFSYKLVNTSTQDKKLWETTMLSTKEDVSFTNADIVIDVIDQKQTYAIDVVKQALSFLGYDKESQNMHHVNYGFVYLSSTTAKMLGVAVDDEKEQYAMSGRKGVGIKVLDLIAIVDKKVSELFGSFSNAQEVTIGALKFEFLKYNTYNDIVFDLESSLNIKGFSGPYLQYTHARAASLLNKAGSLLSEGLLEEVLDSVPFAISDLELAILRHIAKFDDIVVRSAYDFSPNMLCEYLFKLAKLFNTFYNDMPVLNAEPMQLRDFRLFITKSTKIVLHNGLSLLGISAPEKL